MTLAHAGISPYGWETGNCFKTDQPSHKKEFRIMNGVDCIEEAVLSSTRSLSVCQINRLSLLWMFVLVFQECCNRQIVRHEAQHCSRARNGV